MLKNNKLFMLNTIIYKLLLDIIFVNFIVYKWYEMGFWINFNFFNYVVYTAVFIFIAYLFMKIVLEMEFMSKYIMLAFFYLSFIPNMTYISVNRLFLPFTISFIIYWLFLLLFAKIVPNINFKLPKILLNRNILYIVSFVLVFVVIFVSYKYTGFHLNFSLENVYELRENAKDFKLSSVMVYLLGFARVVIPTIFMYSLYKKSHLWAIFLFVVQFLLFSIDGSKSSLFGILSAIVIYVFHYRLKIKMLWLQAMTNGALLLAMPLYFITPLNLIIDLLIRRLLFIPAVLNFNYYQFFSVNAKDFFAQGILGRLGIVSSYDRLIPHIIGETFFGGGAANNGLYSDAFSNLGYLGIIIMPFLLIIVLKMMDVASKNVDSMIKVAAVFTTSFNLIGSSLFTVLASHGLIVLIYVFFLIKNIEENNFKDDFGLSDNMLR